MRLSLSVEDTNRLRAKLGLRLIPTSPRSFLDDTSSPLQRANEVRERIRAAEGRAEERALHTAATEGPSLTSDTSESTSSWLTKMRQKREGPTLAPTVANDPPNAVLVSEPPVSATAQDAPEQPKLSPRIPTGVKRSPNVVSRPPLPALDPLEAPAEPQRELKRRAELDYDSKKAVFKPKRLKASSKARSRPTNADIVLTQPEAEDSALAAILTNSRAARYKRATGDRAVASDEHGSEHLKNETKLVDSGLTIGSSQTFLMQLRQHANNLPQSGSLTELDTTRGVEDESVSLSESDHEVESKVSGVGTSVAETLELLRTEQILEPSSQQVSKSRRDWNQKLLSARLARHSELALEPDAFKHLSPHERQQALDLQKREAAIIDARTARDLFNDYAPSVEVQHRDEHGNVIDGRQAFKRLSRAFHGNATNRNDHHQKRTSYGTPSRGDSTQS